MAIIHRRRPWQSSELKETPEHRFNEWSQLSRRGMLQAMLAGGAAAVGTGLADGADALAFAQSKKKKETGSPYFPARRNEEFKLDRPLTDEQAAARYNNFYEFSTGKRIAALVKDWDINGWKLEVTGLVEKPATCDMDELGKQFPNEYRLYRHRCVEAWAMAVPWTGFPIKKLLNHVKPLAAAKFVKFVSFDHYKAKGSRRNTKSEPFPYTEGLTIAEAANDVAMIVTGIYGKPLPKQHGAPVRMVVPWKYGFKSAKSLVKIELVATRPVTFWPAAIPTEYDFLANVDPTTPHPRWSQTTEWDIGTKKRVPTLPYNGYGEWVAGLYS
jgi:sulfoxide reductase catalytic subunit YedY